MKFFLLQNALSQHRYPDEFPVVWRASLKCPQVVEVSVLHVASGGLAGLGNCQGWWDWRVKGKTIVYLHQISHSILLQAYKTLEWWGLFARTIHTMNYVTLLLFADEENVEDFNLGKEEVILIRVFGSGDPTLDFWIQKILQIYSRLLLRK